MGEQSSNQNEGVKSGLAGVGRPRRPESWGMVMRLLKVMRVMVRMGDQNSDQISGGGGVRHEGRGKTREVMGSVKWERGPRLSGVSAGSQEEGAGM